MLRLMLDSHPDLAIPPETHFCRLFDIPGFDGRTTSALRERALGQIVRSRRWKDFRLDEIDLAKQIRRVPDSSPGGRCLAAFWELYAKKQGKQRWGDKTPGHILCASKIASLFPEARFIHSVRDGRDAALLDARDVGGPATRDSPFRKSPGSGRSASRTSTK